MSAGGVRCSVLDVREQDLRNPLKPQFTQVNEDFKGRA